MSRGPVWSRAFQPRFWAVAIALAIAAATPVNALDFEEAFGKAILSNPDIRAAREEARRVHESFPLALSQRLPALRVHSGATLVRNFTTSGRLDSEQQSVGVSLNQNLYSSGHSTAAIRRAEFDIRRSHAYLETVEQRVLLNVAIAYVDVLRATRAVGLRKRSVESFKAKSEQIATRYRVGGHTRADMAQAEAEWRISVADLAAESASLKTQETVFENLVGVPAAGLQQPREITGLPPTLEAAVEIARGAHPSVRAAGHAVSSAEQEVAAAVGLSGMRIDLEGGFSRSWARTSPRTLPPVNTEARVGLRLSAPLYRGGSDAARIRQASKLLKQRRVQLLAAQGQSVQEAAIAWNEMSAARQRHIALSSAVEASRVALRAIQRQAEIGGRSTREVLDAERKTIEYELAILSAERDIFVSSFRLKAAVGALTAASLGLQNVPDLEREASRTRRNWAPRLFSLERD